MREGPSLCLLMPASPGPCVLACQMPQSRELPLGLGGRPVGLIYPSLLLGRAPSQGRTAVGWWAPLLMA